jgi:general stress protein YciG
LLAFNFRLHPKLKTFFMAEMNSQHTNGSQKKSVRGFAAMDSEKQREIARKGGRAAHEQGVAHEWSSQEAREAGKKGGQARGKQNGRTESPLL